MKVFIHTKKRLVTVLSDALGYNKYKKTSDGLCYVHTYGGRSFLILLQHKIILLKTKFKQNRIRDSYTHNRCHQVLLPVSQPLIRGVIGLIIRLTPFFQVQKLVTA